VATPPNTLKEAIMPKPKPMFVRMRPGRSTMEMYFSKYNDYGTTLGLFDKGETVLALHGGAKITKRPNGWVLICGYRSDVMDIERVFVDMCYVPKHWELDNPYVKIKNMI
jgi:hypothetical protein